MLLLSACGTSKTGDAAETTSPTDSSSFPLTSAEPALLVKSQSPDSSSITVGEAVSWGPGWLVVRAQEIAGSGPAGIGRVIGYSALKDGVNRDVFIKIDADKSTQVMYVTIHGDAGKIGTFEYPGTDQPLLIDGKMVVTTFQKAPPVALLPTTAPTANASPTATATPPPTATAPPTATSVHIFTPTAAASPVSQAQTPAVTETARPVFKAAIKVSDQKIENGIATIDHVTTNGPSWLVVYSETNGQLGSVIGHAALRDGVNQNVRVKVDPSKVTPELYALIHIDSGKAGYFEFPGIDSPYVTEQGIVLSRFNASPENTAQSATGSLPTTGRNTPSISVVDQPIRGGTIKVDQAVSDGPGWFGVHRIDGNGQLGSAIGFAPLVDGVNKDLIIHINQERASKSLVVMIHTDRGKIGTWEFPGPDGPVMVDNQVVMVSIDISEGLPGEELIVRSSGGQTPAMVDGAGYSLYSFSLDSPGVSMCETACRFTWLPLLKNGNLFAGPGLQAGDLGAITLVDGTEQVTYRGLPLYYYAGDDQPGDTNGLGIDPNWSLASP